MRVLSPTSPDEWWPLIHPFVLNSPNRSNCISLNARLNYLQRACQAAQTTSNWKIATDNGALVIRVERIGQGRAR